MNKFIILIIAMLLAGCANTAPRNQPVNFQTPNISEIASIAREDTVKAPQKDNGTKIKSNDSRTDISQENYQAVQNSLIGLSGKLAEFETDIGKLVDINSKIVGLEGELSVLKSAVINLRADIKAEVSAEIKAQIQSEMNLVKASFSNTSNLPVSFMIGLFLMVVVITGGLIFVIYQNNKQREDLRTLGEKVPIIVPLDRSE